MDEPESHEGYRSRQRNTRCGGPGRSGPRFRNSHSGGSSAQGEPRVRRGVLRLPARSAIDRRTGFGPCALAFRQVCRTLVHDATGRVRIESAPRRGAQSPAAMIMCRTMRCCYAVARSVHVSETSLAEYAPPNRSSANRHRPLNTFMAACRDAYQEVELVAGHKCEHVVIDYARQKTDILHGKGLARFISVKMGSGGAWARVISEANGFQLKSRRPNGP